MHKGRYAPVIYVTGCEHVRKRRHVREHDHEAEQQTSRELVPAHAHGHEHAVDVHHRDRE